MKIIHYKEAEVKTYLGNAPKGITGRVVIGKDDGAKDLCMRVFELEPGTYTGKHAHEWEHEVFVHSGKGSILRDGNGRRLPPGVSFLSREGKNISSGMMGANP